MLFEDCAERSASDLEEVWEDSQPSEAEAEAGEAPDEVRRLTATHLSARRFTRKVKEVALHVKYSSAEDERELAGQLKRLRGLLLEVNQKFLSRQKTRFEGKREAVKARLASVFAAQSAELERAQGGA